LAGSYGPEVLPRAVLSACSTIIVIIIIIIIIIIIAIECQMPRVHSYAMFIATPTNHISPAFNLAF